MVIQRIAKISLVILISMLALAGLIGLFSHQVAQASSTTLYVSPDGNCGTETPCFNDIQLAIEAATVGDSILIAAGTYPLLSGRNQVAYVDKALSIRGGYTPDNWETPHPEVNQTILDGTDAGRAIAISNAGEVSVEGLRLVNGNAAGAGGHSDGSDAGGCIYIADTSVTLSHLWVISSTVPISGYGGGIYARQSTVEIGNSLVQGNSAWWGGGIYLSDSNSILNHNHIINNEGKSYEYGGYGAGVAIYGGKAWVSGNTISDNLNIDYYSHYYAFGGGLVLANVDASVSENVIQGNTSGSGGGLYLTGDRPIVVNFNQIIDNSYGGIIIDASNIILNGNTVLRSGGTHLGYGAGIYISSDAILTNNIIAYTGGWHEGTGIFIDNASPRFYNTTLSYNMRYGINVRAYEGESYPEFYNSIISYQNISGYTNYGVNADCISNCVVTMDGVLWWENEKNIFTYNSGDISVTHAITGDPLYIDSLGDNFHINPGSAAIDQGVPTNVLSDIDHQPRLGLPDLGADEYWAPGSFLYRFIPLLVRP